MTTLFDEALFSVRKDSDFYNFVAEDSSITMLEKQQIGRTSLEKIAKGLDEYLRLFKAGIASKGEILTLARAFPDNDDFQKAATGIDPDDVIVVGGPASVEVVDREGHMIMTKALEEAFEKYMGNFRTRNAMVLHSDVQVGWALPCYITKSGQIFKSGVDDKGLFFITELRDDTKISKRVAEQVNDGKLRSYSIAGSATKTQNMEKGLQKYLQVDAMELAEVTICEKGVNQAAGFDIIKGHNSPDHSCVDGSCLIPLEKQDGKIDQEAAGYRHATDVEQEANIKCGTCKFYTGDSCSVVVGNIDEDMWCKLYATHEEDTPDEFNNDRGPTKVIEVTLMANDKGDIDFKKSFDAWMEANTEWTTEGSGMQSTRDHGLVKADKNEPYSEEYLEQYGHRERSEKVAKAEDQRYKTDANDGASFPTLENYEGRDAEHHQLLREYGFPSEQPPEGMRYTPVVEVETDMFGIPIHHKPPWVTNEAGEHLGERLNEDSPGYSKLTKSFLDWMNKADDKEDNDD